MNRNKQTRQSLTLQEKCDIIRVLETGKKQSVVCREKKFSKSTVATIWKKRVEILRAFENRNVSTKKMRKSVHADVDQALLKWFAQKRLDNVIISTAVLKQKAEEFGKNFNNTKEFLCSESWVQRWKKRHNVCSGKIVGEAAAVNIDVVDNWLNTVWPQIKKKFHSNDIFNADETGLFYRLPPDKTLKFKGEKCIGGKMSKERITVLVCANLTGTEKRKLLVIGKTKNPRCFKNVKGLPVNYKANRKAWMTSDLFISELREWDKELNREKRNILLLVDNCPAHPDVKHLKSIKLVFLPPNTSSKLQPMDQGVIHALKSYYRQLLLMKMVQSMDDGTALIINLLDAINLIHKAWQRVSQQTIAKCFQHAGFHFADTKFEIDSDDDLPLSEWIRKERNDFSDIPSVINMDNINDYVTVDDCLVTAEFLTDEDIIATVRDVEVPAADPESDDSEDERDTEPELPVLCVGETVKQMSNIQRFLLSRAAPQNILEKFAEVESYIDQISMASSQVQSKITDFFI